MNGTRLPYLLPNLLDPNEANKLELTSVALTIEQGGSFTRDRIIRMTFTGQVSSESETLGGTYTTSGSAVSLNYYLGGGPAVNGSWSGNTLTIIEGLWSPADPGDTLVYTRQ